MTTMTRVIYRPTVEFSLFHKTQTVFCMGPVRICGEMTSNIDQKYHFQACLFLFYALFS